jgi:TonB C terminal
VYLGQIQGRIHRALQTLTDSIALPSPCNAKVIQDERGRVLDVDLAECALSAEQQQLVKTAIRRASPLPRPPHGLAMGSYLTLNLSSISR